MILHYYCIIIALLLISFENISVKSLQSDIITITENK